MRDSARRTILIPHASVGWVECKNGKITVDLSMDCLFFINFTPISEYQVRVISYEVLQATEYQLIDSELIH